MCCLSLDITKPNAATRHNYMENYDERYNFYAIRPAPRLLINPLSTVNNMSTLLIAAITYAAVAVIIVALVRGGS